MPFYFAVLLPVVLVLLGNMVVLVLVLRAIKDGAQLVKDSKAAKNKKMTQARIAFACAVLLGLTWVFAILAIGELRDFFQWLFCIFNSLQGLFYFVINVFNSIAMLTLYSKSSLSRICYENLFDMWTKFESEINYITNRLLYYSLLPGAHLVVIPLLLM